MINLKKCYLIVRTYAYICDKRNLYTYRNSKKLNETVDKVKYINK